MELFINQDGSYRVVKFNYIGQCSKDFDAEDTIYYTLASSPNEIERISISRTKRVIREYVLNNPFTHFVTLTVSPEFCNRYDIDDCEARLRTLLKKYRRSNKNFIYLLIAEKHAKGGFHFHGFFGGVDPKDLKPFDKNNINLPYKIQKSLNNGLQVYYMDLFQNNLGYCTLSPILSTRRSANYCLKYITKDCVRNSKGTLYICSRGLSRPISQNIKSFDVELFKKFCYNNNTFFNYHKNNFVTVLDFHPDDLPNDLKTDFETLIKDNNNYDLLLFLKSWLYKYSAIL